MNTTFHVTVNGGAVDVRATNASLWTDDGQVISQPEADRRRKTPLPGSRFASRVSDWMTDVTKLPFSPSEAEVTPSTICERKAVTALLASMRAVPQ